MNETKEQICMKALGCLYLEVAESVANDVKQCVIGALNEKKSENDKLKAELEIRKARVLYWQQRCRAAEVVIHAKDKHWTLKNGMKVTKDWQSLVAKENDIYKTDKT